MRYRHCRKTHMTPLNPAKHAPSRPNLASFPTQDVALTSVDSLSSFHSEASAMPLRTSEDTLVGPAYHWPRAQRAAPPARPHPPVRSAAPAHFEPPIIGISALCACAVSATVGWLASRRRDANSLTWIMVCSLIGTPLGAVLGHLLTPQVQKAQKNVHRSVSQWRFGRS